jgi:hypothetical protein
MQLISYGNDLYALSCIRDGVRTVIPKPSLLPDKGQSVTEMITFIESLRSSVRCMFSDPNMSAAEGFRMMRDAAASLRLLEEGSDVPSSLFGFISAEFGRAILFSVSSSGLSAEKADGLGIGQGRGQKPNIVLPAGGYSVFDEAMTSGQVFYDECDDELLKEQIYSKTGEPLQKKVLILPVKVTGQVKALIYADSGSNKALPASAEAYEVLAIEAGLIMENALYRGQLLRSVKK